MGTPKNPITAEARKLIIAEKLLCDIYRDIMKRGKHSGEYTQWEEETTDKISAIIGQRAARQIENQIFN